MENTFLGTVTFALAITVLLLILLLIISYRKVIPYLLKRQTEQQPEFKISLQTQIEKELSNLHANLTSKHQKAFCSYSRKDVEYANFIGEYARGFGKEFVMDVTHLRGGQEWESEIEKLIKESDDFILCLSKNAKKSKYVKKELDFALNLNRKEFIRPFRWERVSIPNEIAHINVTYVPIRLEKHKDGTEKIEISYAPTLKFIRELQPSVVIGLLLLILAITVFAFLGIRELQKKLIAEGISDEELIKIIPPLDIPFENADLDKLNVGFGTNDRKDDTNHENLFHPYVVLERKQKLSPLLTTPNALPVLLPDVPTQLECPKSNPTITSHNSNGGASIKDFSVVGENTHKAGELVMLNINLGNGVGKPKLTPFITELTNIGFGPESSGQNFISVTPDKTTDYLLEVTGKDGITVCKKTTVYITPNKTKSVSSKGGPKIVEFKIQALPPKNVEKRSFYDDVGNEALLKYTKREDLKNFGPRQYNDNGYICYHIKNAKRAIISSIGEIEIGKEKCIEVPGQRKERGKLYEFELSVFGFNGRKISKRIELDMRSADPEFNLISQRQLSSTKEDYEFCFRTKNVRYIVLVTDKNKSQLLYLKPPNDKQICVTKKMLGNPKYLLILGINGDINSPPFYRLN
jgi:hypothetical protein